MYQKNKNTYQFIFFADQPGEVQAGQEAKETNEAPSADKQEKQSNAQIERSQDEALNKQIETALKTNDTFEKTLSPSELCIVLKEIVKRMAEENKLNIELSSISDLEIGLQEMYGTLNVKYKKIPAKLNFEISQNAKGELIVTELKGNNPLVNALLPSDLQGTNVEDLFRDYLGNIGTSDLQIKDHAINLQVKKYAKKTTEAISTTAIQAIPENKPSEPIPTAPVSANPTQFETPTNNEVVRTTTVENPDTPDVKVIVKSSHASTETTTESKEKPKEKPCTQSEDFPNLTETDFTAPDLPHAIPTEGEAIPKVETPKFKITETKINLLIPPNEASRFYKATIIKQASGESKAYVKDRDGKILQVRTYAANGKGTVKEQNGDTIGEVEEINTTTGEEMTITKEMLDTKQKDADELSAMFDKDPPSKLKLFCNALRDVFLMVKELKAWKETMLEGPMAYSTFGDKLSPEWKKHYAEIKYRISEKDMPGAYGVFKSMSVDTFLGNPNEMFEKDAYAKFLGGEKLSRKDINKNALNKHLNKLRKAHPEIKLYPRDEVLVDLYLSMLLNTKDSLANRKNPEGLAKKKLANYDSMTIHIDVKKEEKKAGEKKATDSPKKESKEKKTGKVETKPTETPAKGKDFKIPSIFPANLTVDTFLGTAEEVRKIYDNGEVTLDEIKARITNLKPPFPSYEQIKAANSQNNLTPEEKKQFDEQFSETKYLENIKNAYEQAAKEFYPNIAISVVDFIDDKATAKAVDGSNDGFLDFDEYETLNSQATIKDAKDKLMSQKGITITKEDSTTETIHFNDDDKEFVNKLCSTSSYDFYTAWNQRETYLMDMFGIGQGNKKGEEFIKSLIKLSTDFKNKFDKKALKNLTDKEGNKIDDINQISTARLFELTKYLN